MTSADHRAAYLYTVEPKLITMMQQCASGAKLRTAGPFFRRSIDHVVARVPLPRTIRAQSTIRRRDPIGVYSSPCLDRGAQCNTLWNFTCRRHAPEGDDQFARQRYDHGLSTSAAPLRGPRMEPTKFALFLELEKAPCQLNHAASNAGIASASKTLLRLRWPLSSGAPVRPA